MAYFRFFNLNYVGSKLLSTLFYRLISFTSKLRSLFFAKQARYFRSYMNITTILP